LGGGRPRVRESFFKSGGLGSWGERGSTREREKIEMRLKQTTLKEGEPIRSCLQTSIESAGKLIGDIVAKGHRNEEEGGYFGKERGRESASVKWSGVGGEIPTQSSWKWRQF